jgi:hypothetical protein
VKQKLLNIIAVLGLLTFTAEAQNFTINSIMNVKLVCQVQQEESYETSSTTNLTINTKSLLEMIATDQGFTLPAKAKLWLSGNSFSVLNSEGTIFVNIDTNLLNITYVTTVLKSNLTQTTNTYVNTINGTSVVILNYSGSSVSFTFNCCGKQNFLNKLKDIHAVALSSFSGRGFGPGICNSQNMIIQGSLTGKYSTRYTVGDGVGTFPDDSDMPVPGSTVP